MIYTVADKDIIDKVFLNGVDVTRDCFFADTALGYIKVYKRDANDSKYIARMPGTGKLCQHAAYDRKKGKVSIYLKNVDGEGAD